MKRSAKSIRPNSLIIGLLAGRYAMGRKVIVCVDYAQNSRVTLCLYLSGTERDWRRGDEMRWELFSILGRN